MAITVNTDLKVYEPEFQSGMYESVAQFVAGVVGASQGAISVRSNILPGHYSKTAIWDIASLITRRVTTSVSAIADIALTQDEMISVKLARSARGASTFDAFRKAGKGMAEFSFVLGQQYGEQKMANMLNSGLIAVETAIEQTTTSLNYNGAAGSPLTLITTDLVDGMAKMGDRSGSIVCWVMHSKPYFDLVKAQITDKIYGNANLVVYGGTPASLGRPVVVTDSPALTDGNASLTDTYNVLGLTSGAVQIEESEQEDIVLDTVTGLGNLVARWQAEFSVSVGVKGFRYNTSGGGANPTDAALGTTTNWATYLTSLKFGPGVRITVQ